jgi:hypothetical protein
MARASVTTQKITRAGLNPSYTAPNADGDIIDAGSVDLHVKNGGGSQITVTVETPGTVDGVAIADLSVVVPAAGERLIGPFTRGTFAQPSDATVGPGRVLVSYSGQTSITRAVLAVSA